MSNSLSQVRLNVMGLNTPAKRCVDYEEVRKIVIFMSINEGFLFRMWGRKVGFY